MPGSEATTTDPASDIINSLAADDLPTIGDSELHNKWRQLLIEIRGSKLETDLEKRFSRSNFERAVELALAHPESMSISTEPKSRRHDMTGHVRDHFDNLLNNDDWGAEIKGPRPDVDYLLKACELAYLYDSVYRFSSETVISPKIDGLEDVSFVEVPSKLSDWMGETDLLWLTLADELAAEKPVRVWIDSLYDDRADFVATAKDEEIFLPVSGEYREDLDDVKSKVEKRIARNAHVPPRLIHNYCFTRTIDQFE